jgi:predicted dehydrogenase
LGNIDIVAICNRSNAKEKADSLSINRYYQDYRKMIDECEMDYIHICTPNQSHFNIAKYAIEKGIHIILEKPMTFTVDEAKSLLSLVESKGLKHAINFHNRLYPTAIHLKNLIQNQDLGDIISISGEYLQDWLLYPTDYSWRLDSSLSGKTRSVADIGSHWMDLVEYLTGLRITEVFAEFKTHYKKRQKPIGHIESFSNDKNRQYEAIDIDTEDVAIVMYKFNNGAIGSAQFSQMSAGHKNSLNIEISGTKSSAKWSLEDLENLHIGHRDKPNEMIPKDYLLMKDAKSSIDLPAGHIEGYLDVIKHVFKEIYSDSPSKHYADFNDGLRQMILCDKIYLSAQTHQWIKI